MAFLQRSATCVEHDDCTVIDCVTDADITDDGRVLHAAGSAVWESHAHSDTHAECRANPDHPLEGGDSAVEMCSACVERLVP